MKNLTNFKTYNCFIICIAIVFTVFFNSYGQKPIAICPVSADAFVTDAAPDNCYGSYSSLVVGIDGANDTYHIALKFDLSPIPIGASLFSSFITLTNFVGMSNDDVTFTVRRCDLPWNEGSISYNNGPNFSGPLGTYYTTSGSNEEIIFIDNLVVDWIENGYPNYGLILFAEFPETSSGNTYSFYSKEGSSSNKPVLTVNYELPCTVSVPSGSTVSSSSGSTNISVTSNGVSSWSASESCSWVSISPTSGTGNGNVTATYQQNTSCSSRSCTISFSCGSSSDSYILTQNGASSPGTATVSGSSSACQGQSKTFTASASGATSYSWSAPGCSPSSGSGSSFTTTMGSSSVNICAIPSNSCGSGSQGCKYVTVSNPNANATTVQHTTCAQNNGIVNASGGSSCSWSGGLGSGCYKTGVSPGNYTVTVTDGNGCTDTDNTTVNNSYPPNAVATTTAHTTGGNCNGSVSASGSSSSVSIISYSWSGGLGTGCNHSDVCAGNYTVTVTDSDGCTDTDITTVDPSSSIEDFDFIDYLSIFPNPNTGEFIIEMNITKATDLEIKLLNVIGQVIYTEKLNKYVGAYQKSIDVGEYAKGIYNLQLLGDEGIINRKIVVE